jgi:hypothetical protein
MINENTRPIGWQGAAIQAQLDSTNIKFNVPGSEVLARFNREITFDDDGVPHVIYDKEIVTLADGLTRWAYDNRDPELFDGRSLPRSGAGGGRVGTLSKSDFTLAEKIAFIKEHGGEAYERLPLKSGGATTEVRSKAEYYRLPRQEKMRLLAKDPGYFERLPNTPAEALGGKVNGTFINRAALEKHKAVRPASR